MIRLIFPLSLLLVVLTAAAPSVPAEPVVATPAIPAIPGEPGAPVPITPTLPGKSAADGSVLTRRDARAITQKIPAPRGQIVDRTGQPLAQNSVAYQVALQFRQFEQADREFVVQWARARLAALEPLVKSVLPKTDDELYDHYRNRRWLPLLVSGQIDGKEAQLIEPKLESGLLLFPVYRRYYPQGELAAHVLGYTGIVGKLPTGPINFNEPMFEESEGRAGFEKLFDAQLAGQPGVKRLLFDESGNKLLEEQVSRPVVGGTVVTTLNLSWQRLAEKTLRNGCRRGAFVVIDVITGEVLVMASRPSFDLNRFIPGISDDDFNALKADPSDPLFGRAFQSAYPPASSFKPIVALAALDNGTITKNSEIYCPASIRIGNTTMKNWSKTPEGSINVRRALARSCNPWFYQVGINVGPTAFLNLARRLGFGDKTGLPLLGETAGLVPNDEWMLKHERRRILNGDTANMSIGQGPLLASPLQVAQAMAGIANGGVLPRLQLVMQIQDSRGRVIKAPVPERRTNLGVDPKAVEVVRAGMGDVVSAGYGTGRSGALSYTELCGKTGTAQWNKARGQRLAWFAGFLPRDNPRYAFAVLYEGRPGETVSGGKMAAPMVRAFFEGIKSDIKDIITPTQNALIVEDDEPEPVAETADAPPLALPIEDDKGDSKAKRKGGNKAPRRPLPEAVESSDDEPVPALPLDTGDDEVMDENQ